MKRIALVTDSTADLTPALIKDWNVHVIPLKIRFAGEEFYDGELTAEEFYQRLRNASALPYLRSRTGRLLTALPEFTAEI